MVYTDMPGGRPPTYDTVEELEAKIREYFTDEAYKVIVPAQDGKEAVKEYRPTISGLALFLGFESRQSFYDYEEKEEFSYTIKRARLLMEQYYEERLAGNNVTGIIFALKQFGWQDKQEVEHSGTVNVMGTIKINGQPQGLDLG